MTAELQTENSNLRAANAEVRASLTEAGARLRAVLRDEAIGGDTPIEATTAMELALETIDGPRDDSLL